MNRITLTLLAGIVACGGATDPEQLPTAPVINVAPSAQVELAVGQSIRLTDPDIVLRFHAVPEDSRCPINAVCVWAGDARIALVASGSIERNFDLHLPGDQIGPRKITLGAYEVEALTLLPAPVAGEERQPGDYRVTLKVRRL